MIINSKNALGSRSTRYEDTLFNPNSKEEEEGIHAKRKHEIFINWDNKSLDIIKIKTKEFEHFAFSTDNYSGYDIQYFIEFDAFEGEFWLHHLMEKGWLDINDIADVGQAIITVIANDYKKPDKHNMRQKFIPYDFSWRTFK